MLWTNFSKEKTTSLAATGGGHCIRLSIGQTGQDQRAARVDGIGESGDLPGSKPARDGPGHWSPTRP